MKIIIVDENDNEIGIKERSEMKDEDIYRVSALWLTNNKGQILLARRAYNKKQHPGEWGPAVAGTVEEGETYESNIIKEAEEELGIKNVEFVKGIKDEVKGKYHHFNQWYHLKKDFDISDFKVNEEEVAEIKWFDRDEILDVIKNGTDDVLESMKNLFDREEFK